MPNSSRHIFRLAATTLACAVALTVAPTQAATYFAVLPLQGANASQAQRPVKMALAGATPPPATVGMPYSFNLGALLSLDGPEGTSTTKVRWSVVSGELPVGLELVGNEVVGTPTELAEGRSVVIQAEYASGYSTVGTMASYSFAVPEAPIVDFGGYRAWADGSYAQSCEGYIRSGSASYPYRGAVGDGVYRIAPSGAAAFDAYCDQTSDGGGWTRVALQYEGSPVAWVGANNAASYTLAQSQIPIHTYTAFGRENRATFVDYVRFSYTTENIPVTVVVSPKTGLAYRIHRDTGSYYDMHDPELRLRHPGDNLNLPLDPGFALWTNTLTFNVSDGKPPSYTWAFSPRAETEGDRGYAMNSRLSLLESFGWSVWVK